jgi:hypothetical protein
VPGHLISTCANTECSALFSLLNQMPKSLQFQVAVANPAPLDLGHFRASVHWITPHVGLQSAQPLSAVLLPLCFYNLSRLFNDRPQELCGVRSKREQREWVGEVTVNRVLGLTVYLWRVRFPQFA